MEKNMKKFLIIMALLVTTALCDTKGEFELAVEKYGCRVDRWLANDYESGMKWRFYAKVACPKSERMPVRIAGLKFLDVSTNLKGEYIFTYGVD